MAFVDKRRILMLSDVIDAHQYAKAQQNERARRNDAEGAVHARK